MHLISTSRLYEININVPAKHVKDRLRSLLDIPNKNDDAKHEDLVLEIEPRD